MTPKEEIAAFERWHVRRQFDEETETWYFSVVDIVGVLTEQPTSRGAALYWGKLKSRLKQEGSELLTDCQQLKLTAEDGKKRLTDVANVETLLRLIQSVPSPKAEPIKLWLARVGYERIKETEDPEAGIARARADWKRQGRSDDWINQRMLSIRVRNSLTDFWDEHGIKEGAEFARLTGITHKEWTGLSVRQHKDLKGLKSQNLRDHMSDAELVLTMLAEISTKQIAEKMEATGFDENAEAAKDGGGVAKKAREELESKSGKSALSGSNFLSKKK
ncbi:BRO family protein [Desulfovibrio sp.]|uniref:BRO family protein n=1 Tax=Desulfovibrio sp. TaxID=885 RepID=UPI0025C07417|nr:BRO family protein [Desulfovibrio sp.]